VGKRILQQNDVFCASIPLIEAIPNWTPPDHFLVFRSEFFFFPNSLRFVLGLKPRDFDPINHVTYEQLGVYALSCAAPNAPDVIPEHAVSQMSGVSKFQHLSRAVVTKSVNGSAITMLR
jgi:hypothetical protein